MLESWKKADPHELRIVLDKFVDGPGQHDKDTPNKINKIYLPLGRDDCFISLKFKDKRIRSVEPGPAFDQKKWEAISHDINDLIFGDHQRIVRWWTFSSYRVSGSWRGDTSRVQILPPFADTPNAPVEMADHPFLLEHPFYYSGYGPLDQYRAIREHRKLTLLLNVLLRGSTKWYPLNSRDQHWALIASDVHSPTYDTKWVQRGFFSKIAPDVLDALSPPDGGSIGQVEPTEYYSDIGHDGRPLRVPTNLDDAICTYRALCDERRDKFDRAAYWFAMAAQHWSTSYSASFASLVSAIEALTTRGDRHTIECPHCRKITQHDDPGPTQLFRDFLEKYASGTLSERARTDMYQLRSGILHGSNLMELDEQKAFGWDPPGWIERELHSELWNVTRTALRNWLITVSLN